MQRLIEKPFPGATTAIVIGPPAPTAGRDLASYRIVLCCASPADLAASTELTATTPLQTISAVAPDLAETVEAFVLEDPAHMPSIYVNPDAIARDSAIYEAALTLIFSALESCQRARMTREKDGYTWQLHLLQNLSTYLTRRMPSSWRNALAGIPAFVCGAGPSLDVSAPLLAQIAAQGVVFSADSALRSLAKRGISADFAVSVDVAKVPEKCLPETAPPSRVILSVVSPPAWQNAIPEHRRFVLSGAHLTLDWLAEIGVARTEIPVTESCGSTALELARFLGCAPIYLFGLDLAADTKNPAKRHHSDADASLYTRSGYDPTHRQPMVPGNYADEVPSFMQGDWRALDDRLAGWPANLVINVNDRGARLRNATLVHPDRFVFTAGQRRGDLLTKLPQPDTDSALQARVRNELKTAAAAAQALLPVLRERAHAGDVPAVVNHLRSLYRGASVGRVLGSFSLRLMPQLLPPINPDTAHWETVVAELETLLKQLE